MLEQLAKKRECHAGQSPEHRTQREQRNGSRIAGLFRWNGRGYQIGVRFLELALFCYLLDAREIGLVDRAVGIGFSLQLPELHFRVTTLSKPVLKASKLG